MPVLWGVYQSIKAREWASMDLLASVALIFSIISREWTSVIFIALMLAAARMLDSVTKDHTEKSIKGLLKLRSNEATIERNGVMGKVATDDIALDDIVVVGLGERIPVDGVVLSGDAAVDESSLTGESLPVDKNVGSGVMSSTLVRSGSLRIKTERIGKDTTLERIIALVESAQSEKPSSQTLGERFGKIYLISIFIGSALLYLLTSNLPLVLAVVLVVCADDVAVAIPIAYLRAIKAASKDGVIVKGSKHLETLGNIDTIVFDKTGTLTKGELTVRDLIPAPGRTEHEVLRWGMLASMQSKHPLSRAFVAHAKELGVGETFPDTAEEKGGKGIVATRGTDTVVLGKRVLMDDHGIAVPDAVTATAEEKAAQGRSVSYIAVNGQLVGCFTASDTIKDNAPESLRKLQALGVKNIVMLTGDSELAAQAIAKELGVTAWQADLLPEQKVDAIRKLQVQQPVAMVGDGVNDTAALSIAAVGIAMGGLGSEATLDAAEIILMRDDLAALPHTIEIARRTRDVSIQDFWIWGISNIFGLLLVFGGVIGPAGAAAYNFLSDFIPLFNSLRIRKVR